MKKTHLLFLLLFVSFANVIGQNNAQFISQSVPSQVDLNEVFYISITFKNTGTVTWPKDGQYRMGSQSPQDNTTWGTNRVALTHAVSPGQHVTISTSVTAPNSENIYGIPFQWRMVQDGVAWFGEPSDPLSIRVGSEELEDRFLMPAPTFEVSDHIVATSVFHWYGATTGQVSSPWLPVEGRENWTGEVPFWKTMIKQAMAANIDVFYILVIPTMEQPRINLFRALNELRREGWDVPKVCPFFDPIITYALKGSNGDASTQAGKDEIVSHYIRFYQQYYSVNFDDYADDYIYTQNNMPVLDTWHVYLNINNYSRLTATDVSSRLANEFGRAHPIFNNGIKMITTANSPSFGFANEQVHQFEAHEYYIEKNKNGIVSAQLKPGYWDQNVRNPGYLLPRNGGSQYKNAWSQLGASVSRVYIESFNEYDEGSGIYAANTDVVYKKTDGGMNNTGNDVWSSSNDPYEYIKTTAEGAANFNEDLPLDSKIIWHDFPNKIYPGDTHNVTVILRNEGNTPWNNANDFKFGQQDSDAKLFGSNRYTIDDTKHDIPDYGGIFRGRTIAFHLQVTAPSTTGVYETNWKMLQENVAWFGETLTKSITVTTDAPLAIEDVSSQNQFKIYPNPANPHSDLQIHGNFKKKDRIVLFTISGSKITEKIMNRDGQIARLDLQNIPIAEGVYIVQIIGDSYTQTKKLILKN